MKNSIVCLMTLGIALSWACSRIEQETPLSEGFQEGTELTVRATLADGADTRTVLRPDKSIFWTPGDAINLFYGDLNSGKFTTDITEPKQVTNFVGTLTTATGSSEAGLGARKFWGVYPYNEENTCDGSSVTITLPAVQNAVTETFADNFNPSVAMASGLDLAFYNVCAPFYFSVTQENVTSATFKGNKNEILAGKVKVKMDTDGYPVATVVEGETSITINAPAGDSFVPGTKYIILLLPQTLSAGYTVSFKQGAAQAECVVSTSSEFARSKGRQKLEADKDLKYVSSQPENAIYYTSTDGAVVTPYAPENFGATIVSNEYSNGQGVITFSGPVTKIGKSAFDGCSTLASIYVPEKVSNIGDEAFLRCTNLTEIVLPEGLLTIGVSSFSNCSKLSNMILPRSLSSIGNYAFNNCSSLKNITIYEGVTLIRRGTFNGCTGLTKVSLPDCITKIDISAFFKCSGMTSINIPTSVTNIETNAFTNCSSLTDLTLPQGVKSIGDQAFNNCKKIVSMAIPDSVNNIGEAVFGGCTSLRSFSGKYASSDGKFLVKDGRIIAVALASLQGSVTIPSNVTTIGASAFRSCSAMTAVTIPESVTSIEDDAFYNCSGLESVTVLPKTPPTAGESILTQTNNAPIYVPSASVTTYKAASGWSNYSGRIFAIQ